MQKTMHREGKGDQLAEQTTLNEISKMSTAILHVEKSLVDIGKSNIRYAGASELQYAVKFKQARIKQFVNDILHLKVLRTCAHSTLFAIQEA